MRFRLLLSAVITAGTLITGGLFAAANAAPAPGGPITHSPTLACQVEFSGACVEPVAAQAVPASFDLIPGDDAAMTLTGPGPVIGSSLDNDQQDGTQDFAFAHIANVPHPGGGPGAYSFTGFDRHNYGGDPVYLIEWVPFGFDTGLCAQTTSNKLRLAACDGGADQAFIITPHVPLAGYSPVPYVWALSVLQVANVAHHNCLTMPRYLTGAQLTTQRCVHRTGGGPQYWSAIP